MTQEVALILRRRDFFGWTRETLHEIGGPVGSYVFVMQVWNGPKQGSLGAKMYLLLLVAGSNLCSSDVLKQSRWVLQNASSVEAEDQRYRCIVGLNS